MGRPKANNEAAPPTKGELQARCEGMLNGMDRKAGFVQYELNDIVKRCDALTKEFGKSFKKAELETIAAVREIVSAFLVNHGEDLANIRTIALELQTEIKTRGV